MQHARGFEVASPRARLLWLPALGVPARKYDPLGRALSAQRVEVLVHEWRGTGEHPAVPSRTRDWGYADLLREDVLPAVRLLAARDPACPLWVGGHSLGGQFAALAAALAPESVRGLALVATGVPYWRLFPRPFAWAIAGFGGAMPVITRLVGHYPGHLLRFAGREAAGLMRDWARTVRTGNYDTPRFLPSGMERALAALRIPVVGLRPADDALSPAASLQSLLDRCGSGTKRHDVLSAEDLGVAADHFRWMRQPDAVVARILAWAGDEALLSS